MTVCFTYGKQVKIIHKKKFSFLSLKNRVILRKTSSFCINFLLLCLLCVYFAPYTLKKSHAFIRLSVNFFVIYTLAIAKKGLYTLSS